MGFHFSTKIFHFRQNLLLIRPSAVVLISPFSTLSAQNPFYTKSFSRIFQQCSKNKASEPGRQAHARMIVTGFKPTVIDVNCLLQMYVKSSRLECASKVFDRMPQRDCVSWTTMMFGYSVNGKMGLAQSLFDLMPEKNVVSWTSLISGYIQNGNCLKSIGVFVKMGRDAVAYNETTLSLVLKAIGILEDDVLGVQLHGVIVKLGFGFDVVTVSALMSMYANCRMLNESLQLYIGMLRSGMEPNEFTYSIVLKACADREALEYGREIHGRVIKCGMGPDSIVSSTTIDMYCKCGALAEAEKLHQRMQEHTLVSRNAMISEKNVVSWTAMMFGYLVNGKMGSAQSLFDLMPEKNVTSWNCLISGYMKNGNFLKSIGVFVMMGRDAVAYDEFTLSLVLKACASIEDNVLGVQIHGVSVKLGFGYDVVIGNATMHMYTKCQLMDESLRIFDEMPLESRDLISWSVAAIIVSEQYKNKDTLSRFLGMLRLGMEPKKITYRSVLNACAGGKALENGREIHGRVIKCGMGSNSLVSRAMIDMYCKCGKVKEAEKLHERMKKQTPVSWNAIISGYLSIKETESAQNYFLRMLEKGIRPDKITFATVLRTCSDAELGKQIHAHIIKRSLQSKVCIISTLGGMYSKCGNLQDSVSIFEKSSNRDVECWTNMVHAHARLGDSNEALQVFEKMVLEKVKPKNATFVGVLRACADVGRVHEALHYLKVMKTEYGLEPKLKHYACMVDALGRSGRIMDALKLIKVMPLKANVVIWMSLLSNCKMHGDVKVAEIAARNLLRMDPRSSSAYVLISQTYAGAGMWGKALKMRKEMRKRGLKKKPGCSMVMVSSI